MSESCGVCHQSEGPDGPSHVSCYAWNPHAFDLEQRAGEPLVAVGRPAPRVPAPRERSADA